MTPYVRLDTIAAPLPLANVDTDKILAARFMKTISRKGLRRGLFAAFREDPQRDGLQRDPLLGSAPVTPFVRSGTVRCHRWRCALMQRRGGLRSTAGVLCCAPNSDGWSGNVERDSLDSDQIAAAERSGGNVAGAYDDVTRMGAAPLWRHYGNLFPQEPKSRAVPFLWRYAEVRGLLDFFTGVMSLEEAERRVLMFVNPGLTDVPATLSTLFAGIQAILPGETARPHRHISNAFRFIIEGNGAYTTVNGEPVVMSPGDLLLTPAWHWHDHVHNGKGPMFWLDGLDYPFVNMVENGFFEHYKEGERQPETVPPGLSSRLFTHGRLNPAWDRPKGPSSPIGNYSWAQTQAAFDAIGGDVTGSPTDGIVLDYVNPWTGGPVMPTIGCRVARLRKGFLGRPRRTSTNTIFHVVEGEGTALVGGVEMAWGKGDTFAVPSWEYYELRSSKREQVTLFSYSDEPMRRALGLFREELAS
jgi:gentisate 1,2-dioxygenase